ncbi:MAG: c-type cytochrome [Pseudomonadota bacterium]
MAEAPKTPAATGDSPRATTSTDSTRGRELFVSKGCVLCHSINGVGGRAGPPLDAPADGASDPVDFAARIWRGAPAMVELQSLELGYVIDLTSEEIRLLAAFAGSRSEQALLSKDDLPSSLADAVLDEDFWRAEDWREFLRNGQELTDTEE